ncbi:hypothetical protein MBLNU230_g6188t1 [Neophaeotheca triangularis]
MNFDNLRDRVSNLTLYDVKAGVRQVQNAVMNYTEMEAKVREATNNEPWGASSTLMQEIASGTFNYQLLNEIMPMIYKRFTEKSAEEWRQIYKALQLMEFLVKNGSERVIDDARSHLSLLKMLKQFHYIDMNGKDQGINVRNRSKELTDLLSDVDRIRSERKKARATRNKYGGVEGGAGIGGSGVSTSGRYGGFGSESAGFPSASYGGSTRGVYGDGGGFGGESQMEYEEPSSSSSSRRQERFDEYDEFDDGGAQATPGRRKADTSSSRRAAPKKAEQPKPKEPEVDLFDFGDDDAMPAPAASNGSANILAATPSSASAAPALAPADDDDFDDFQSATPQPTTTNTTPSIPKPNYSSISTSTPSSNTQYAQPTPQQGSQPQAAAFSNIFSTVSPPTSTSGTPKPQPFSPPTAQQNKQASGYQPSGPNYFTSVQTSNSPAASPGVTSPGASNNNKIGTNAAAKKPAGGGDAFASLLGGAGMKKAEKPKGMTIAEMNRQKAQQGLYGANAAPAAQQGPQGQGQGQGQGGGSAMDDLLG